jgi:AcrR family transcriptional regulator
MVQSRNPEATKLAILNACLSSLAAGGPDGVSLIAVARTADVNRSTVYDYYRTRENLIAETTAWISNRLFRAVFGELETLGERPFENTDVLELNRRLVNFSMANPELCRVWLMQVLAMPDPTCDPFWREYEGSVERFASTEVAQRNIDPEVYTVLILAGAFLWPVRARTRNGKTMLAAEAERFLQESIRLALYGALRPEFFPDLAKAVARPAGAARKPRPRVQKTV